MNGESLRSQAGLNALGTLALAINHIWRARCLAKFEDQTISGALVIRMVEKDLRLLNMSYRPKRTLTKQQAVQLERFGIVPRQVWPKGGTWLGWSKPSLGHYKINTDGAFKDGLAAIGIIIRNDKGDVVLAHWDRVNVESSDQAEVEALGTRIALGQELGLTSWVIETDSSVAFGAFRGKRTNLKMYYWAKRFGFNNEHLELVRREVNRTADCLAKHGLRSSGLRVTEIANIPRDAN
ncbi:hypothetical protein CASFOL_037263 [Castilleja foliolosa]|uniref:RNase H type-1 domain-containing protein n=1 Tax=Castilleja foliolosa TaxID=1961234 RepID=A0ABD3BNJ4_9LAMI